MPGDPPPRRAGGAAALATVIVPAFAAALGAALLAFAFAAQALEIVPGQHYRGLAAEVGHYMDDEGSLARGEAVEKVRSGCFAPIQSERINFGYTDAKIWLHLPVRNAGSHTGRWRVSLNIHFMSTVDAFIVRGDGSRISLARDHFSLPFAARNPDYRTLVGDFALDAGEVADLFVAYTSGGTTALPLSIETPASFEHRQALELAKNAAFYAVFVLLILFSLLFLAMLRMRVFLAYTLYLGAVTLYVMQSDGVAFQFLYPDLPAVNAVASLPLGLSINFFAANFTREFLQTRSLDPLIDKILLGFMAVTAALVVAGPFFDTRPLKQLAFLYTAGSTLLFLLIGVAALLKRRRGARFFVIGWSGLAAAAATATFVHWGPSGLAVDITYDLIRVGMLFDAVLLGLAVIDRLNGIRAERDRALQGELEGLRRRLALKRHVATLKERSEAAVSLADARRLQLAGASHDLRQPLFSLRAAITEIFKSPGAGDAVSRRLEQSLGYLEKLIDRYLDDTTKQSTVLAKRRAAEPGEDEPAPDRTAEDFRISSVLDNVEFLFAQQAREKGLQFRYVPSTAMVRADPLAVMRILNNLVSNAVKYTRSGAVLLGCRQRAGSLEIEVYDTGGGIAAADVERVMAAKERGNEAEGDGHGLGLAIAVSLARSHNYGLAFSRCPSGGTRACLSVPRCSLVTPRAEVQV